MEESVGVSYADKFISFEGALTDRDIKTLVSESRSDTILQTNYMPLDTATLQELNRRYFAKLEMQPYGSIVRMTVISRLLSV